MLEVVMIASFLMALFGSIVFGWEVSKFMKNKRTDPQLWMSLVTMTLGFLVLMDLSK